MNITRNAEAAATAEMDKVRDQVRLVCEDCGNIMLSREMFIDLHRMVEKNPKMQQGDYFYEYITDTYVAHATMMLRKHTKVCKDSISLAGLAQKILYNSEQLGTIFNKSEFRVAMEHFFEHARRIEAFADRVVAHRDRRPPDRIPTYGDIERAIGAMDKLCILCSLAVDGDYQDSCKPTVQYGWLTVFRDMGIET